MLHLVTTADELPASTPDDAELPATYDRDAKAAYRAVPRSMDSVSIRIAVLRSAHATWPQNKRDADAELWHYGTRAIAGDYGYVENS